MMPKIMGIMNLTDDSFSDAEQWKGAPLPDLLAQMVADGADIIDIGAESTRPGARAVAAEEEWERLAPALEALQLIKAKKPHIIVSVDTRHAATAKKALSAGADWINDVSGFTDVAMIEAVKHSECGCVVMHSMSVPADPAHVMDARGEALIAQMQQWQEETLGRLEKGGVARHRVVLDPGIGFGKDAEQSLYLLRHSAQLRRNDAQLLIGHSRKSFMQSFCLYSAAQRDIETQAISLYLAGCGVHIIRVHDVAGAKRSLVAWGAVAGEGEY